MRIQLLCVSASLAAVLAAVPLIAQQQVGPIYPEKPQGYSASPSGYDPSQLDWYTGRFRYVPIPYDQMQPGGPSQFNFYTGRWDYTPVPAPGSAMPGPTNSPARMPPPLQTVIRNIRPPTTEPAGQLNYAVPPMRQESFEEAQQAQSRQQPTTRPTRMRRPPTTDPLHLNPNVGRWEYDSSTNRWIHILPSD